MPQMYLTKNGLMTSRPPSGTYGISLKVYYEKYDLQGDEVFVGKDITTIEEWEAVKRMITQDYEKRFTVRGKYKIDTFGYGVYKDNEKNRRLGRVGKPYRKGVELLQAIDEAIQRGDYEILNEDRLIQEISSNIREQIRRKYGYYPSSVNPYTGEPVTYRELELILKGKYTGAGWFE